MVLGCCSTSDLPISTPMVTLVAQQPLCCHPHEGEETHLMKKQLLVSSHICKKLKSLFGRYVQGIRSTTTAVCDNLWAWSNTHRLSIRRDIPVLQGWQARNSLDPFCAWGGTILWFYDYKRLLGSQPRGFVETINSPCANLSEFSSG